VFGVPFDRFQDQVELIGGVDFACDTVKGVVFDQKRFVEVVKPIDTLCVVVSHEENHTGAVFRAGDQGEMIRAEIEHGVPTGRGAKGGLSPRPQRR
jgi:hypothetical protein